jgi:hypothetical protein
VKFSVSRQHLFSFLCVAVASSCAMLAAGATTTSAKMLKKVVNRVSWCSQGTCSHSGGECTLHGLGGGCACITSTAKCMFTN